MSVSNLIVHQDYIGNGVQTSFAIPFAFLRADQIKVESIDQTTGVITPLVVNTNYTLDPVNAPVNVIFAVAPAAGKVIRLYRGSVINQTTEIENNGEFLEEEMETALDKLTLIMQEVSDRAAAAMILHPLDQGLVSTYLPKIVANGVIASNGAGTAYVWRAASDFVGPQGPQGVQGVTGPTGATGPTGPTGYAVRLGTGIPPNGLGADGDIFINTTNSNLYYKVTGVWVAQGSLQGIQGPVGQTGATGATGATGPAGTNGVDGLNGKDGSQIYTNSGVPLDSFGADGDFYIDTVAPSNYYQKITGQWVLRNALQGLQGPPGVDGAIGPTAFGLFIQAGVPSNGFGNNNDVYIDTNTYLLYYKITGAWVAQGSLRPPGFDTGGTTGQIMRKASNADYDTEWHTLVKGDIGLGAVDNTADTGKPVSILQQTALNLKADITYVDTQVGTKQNLLPAGSNGQHLVLSGGVPTWEAQAPALPVGGSTGQALIKASATDGDATWQSLPSGLPVQTGNNGKHLTTNGTTASWTPEIVPTGGTTAQALVKVSGTDYDMAWATIDPGLVQTALQTIASGGTAAIPAGRRKRIKVKSNGGVLPFVLPNGTVDTEELFVQGGSDIDPLTLIQASNVYLGGPGTEVTFSLYKMGYFIWDAANSIWILSGGNI